MSRAFWEPLSFLKRFGVFAFAFYPLGLELSVEVIYPVDEAAGASIFYLSGQILGVMFVILANLMASDLEPSELEIEVGIDDLQYVQLALFKESCPGLFETGAQ